MTRHLMPIKVRDELARKLRALVKQFGSDSLRDAVIVGMYDTAYVSDIPYVTCPTLGSETLGNVSYSIARAFEDA